MRTKAVVTEMLLLFTKSWRLVPNTVGHSESFKENRENVVRQETHKNQLRYPNK